MISCCERDANQVSQSRVDLKSAGCSALCIRWPCLVSPSHVYSYSSCEARKTPSCHVPILALRDVGWLSGRIPSGYGGCAALPAEHGAAIASTSVTARALNAANKRSGQIWGLRTSGQAQKRYPICCNPTVRNKSGEQQVRTASVGFLLSPFLAPFCFPFWLLF